MTFATDIDLLHWEPNLMRDASAAAQTLLSGTGAISGTTFTISSGSLIDAKIEVDQVIVLNVPISGSFPIVSIDSSTTLTLSVLYDQLFPTSGGPVALSPVAAGGSGTSGISYWIRTFWPQRRIVSELLLAAAGIDVNDVATLANPEVLTRPCVLGTLQMIYTALAAVSDEPAPIIARAELYERLYRRAMRSITIRLDTDSDGITDVIRPLNVLQLFRG